MPLTVRSLERKQGGAAVAIAAALTVLVSSSAAAQDGGAEAKRPPPRWPDGRISFTGLPGESGNWEGSSGAGAELLFLTPEEAQAPGTRALPTNLLVDDVPFQPWARAVFDYRQTTLLRDEPHVRCKASGAARLFHTPYGLEILDLPDAGEIIFVGVGGPHSWRVVHMDGRSHPENPEPTRYGHSIGHWEGDTLVIDTVGFTENFWMNRLGAPHTSQLRTIERLSRPDFDTLVYEITIDDPGAYTEVWSGGWILTWSPNNEPFDYLCQENNLDVARMVGPQG